MKVSIYHGLSSGIVNIDSTTDELTPLHQCTTLLFAIITDSTRFKNIFGTFS